MNSPMTLKPGVSLVGASAELAIGLHVIKSVFDSHGVPLTLTAVTDGRHGSNSLHYRGRAVDIRLPSRFTGDLKSDGRIIADLRLALGDEWDCVLEPDHFHVEHDPKPGKVVPA